MTRTVLVFPQDPAHRLVADHLASFFDRLVERVMALGDGAHAKLEAGKVSAEVDSYIELVATIAEAREAGKGKQDLSIELRGEVRDDFARYIGARTCRATFQAFVRGQTIKGAKSCAKCGWPLDLQGKQQRCRQGCGSAAKKGRLTACWWLRLQGSTNGQGLGERFVREGRRLVGTPFFGALEGTARTPLYEWHGQ